MIKKEFLIIEINKNKLPLGKKYCSQLFIILHLRRNFQTTNENQQGLEKGNLLFNKVANIILNNKEILIQIKFRKIEE